jgi:hypothetical protein
MSDYELIKSERLNLALKVIDLAFAKYDLDCVIALASGESTKAALEALKEEITIAIKTLIR